MEAQRGPVPSLHLNDNMTIRRLEQGTRGGDQVVKVTANFNGHEVKMYIKGGNELFEAIKKQGIKILSSPTNIQAQTKHEGFRASCQIMIGGEQKEVRMRFPSSNEPIKQSLGGGRLSKTAEKEEKLDNLKKELKGLESKQLRMAKNASTTSQITPRSWKNDDISSSTSSLYSSSQSTGMRLSQVLAPPAGSPRQVHDAILELSELVKNPVDDEDLENSLDNTAKQLKECTNWVKSASPEDVNKRQEVLSNIFNKLSPLSESHPKLKAPVEDLKNSLAAKQQEGLRTKPPPSGGESPRYVRMPPTTDPATMMTWMDALKNNSPPPTASKPDNAQIEVAIKALKGVLPEENKNMKSEVVNND